MLAAEDMTAALYRAGWTADDLKEFVWLHKYKAFEKLDTFAGGALSELKGTPLFNVMLEVTAIRFALEKTSGRGVLVAVPDSCPHGYRQERCHQCIREGA